MPINLCQLARNSVSSQIDMFDLARRDHGLSILRLHQKTKIAKSTLNDWATGTPMPAWALFKLGKVGGVPDDLLSMVGEAFERHVATDEDGEGDLDTAAVDAGEAQNAVQRARHPNSPGGIAIVPQERAAIIPLMRKTAASARRTARA